MAASLSGLSASVTRILYLTGFPKELKTKDIQAAFADYENASGGFKIKWRDDTSLLIVFHDAAVAKRAYLNTVAFPPPILTSSAPGLSVSIRPYDGPDAQAVIQNVNSRGQHNSNPSRTHNPRAASVSVFPNSRSSSNSNAHPNNSANHHSRNNHSTATAQHIPPLTERSEGQPSPTLPSLPSHPTLNALISSSLGEAVAGTNPSLPADPAILTTSLQQQHESLSGPRIGDPGKRMLGAALGVRHPALGPRMVNGGGGASPGPAQGNGVDHMRDMQRAMGGLVVAE
ncbi:hypothetical protein JR316_0000453 [Psilocybe cubensis]|uniref:Uncharacterized protein n=2 Tax=Psilocybe cubensis TaxID=181762 RepID=A0A8H8CR65_PSICU|nr:hypothetical protein JR316_0000453 [Psilocybe cubensis]KAH9486389.1 hypothetical protein JR316_0000453 [Psilocybe cubensis]